MTVLISRFCNTCKAVIKIWKYDGRWPDGRLVERCLDCGGTDLIEHREEADHTKATKH